MRKTPLVKGSFYHIFNRGVNKGDVFFSEADYKRFLDAALHYKANNSKFSLRDKNSSPTNSDPVSDKQGEAKVQVLAYCLMSNHFHFLVKQLTDSGITEYFRRLANGYSHYINIKYKRVGPLFQGRFKSVFVETDEQLIHLSRYIHLNPVVSHSVSDPMLYRWSSYRAYLQEETNGLTDSVEQILGRFKSKKDYGQFVLDQVDYGNELEKIKHLALEN